ncbi:MAG TPA: hypothetical protein VE078_10925 [Thermoanaerobaculia bacterium]|nr:hypothetical protein [Thermoanaerobaculia bacterium]
MKSSRWFLLYLACGVLGSLAALGAQTPAAAPLAGGGEAIDVEIKLVPFYAVDEDGKPVFDLKQDEIELRLDGKATAVDSFDAFPKVAAGDAEKPALVTRGSAKPARRHVVLFFDISFSNPRGFENGKKFAEKVLGELPENDLLYLVTHDFVSGLKQRLGPIAATPSGRSKLLADLKKLKPESGHIDANANYGSLPLVSRGSVKNGIPSGQNSALENAVRTTSQAQLESTGRSLAESMQALADQFQRIREPKLLVFLAQGIDPTLYWEGSDIGLQFSTMSLMTVKSYQYHGLHTLYEKPLQQLADSGTMSLFVNLDDKGGRIRENDTSMQHMARASGGLYLGGVDPALVSDRFARSTAAYYEAGFYLTGKEATPSRAKVEVVVKRPGVRVWSAGSIKTRETWRGLSEEARRLLIVDLIEGDVAAQRARGPVRLDLQSLPGNVLGRSAEGKTVLRYEAGWPQELADRKIDLYNVVLEPTRQAGSPNILSFDGKEDTRIDRAGKNIEVEVPQKAVFVWGIVAVEPTTGKAWYRRFQLQGKP